MTLPLAASLALGLLLGWAARSALVALDAHRDSRAITAQCRAQRADATSPLVRRDVVPEVVPEAGPALIRTRFCPQGYSAKQVLGYYDGGARRVEPSFPGGIDRWDAQHGRQQQEAA